MDDYLAFFLCEARMSAIRSIFCLPLRFEGDVRGLVNADFVVPPRKLDARAVGGRECNPLHHALRLRSDSRARAVPAKTDKNYRGLGRPPPLLDVRWSIGSFEANMSVLALHMRNVVLRKVHHCCILMASRNHTDF